MDGDDDFVTLIGANRVWESNRFFTDEDLARANLANNMVADINREIDSQVIVDLSSAYDAIVRVSNRIFESVRSGAGWLVTTPEVASVFDAVRATFTPGADIDHTPKSEERRVNWMQEGF